MKWFLIVSDLLIPMIILGILCYGILRQVAVYDVFVKGAKSGFLTVAKIIPTMVGLMVAVGILRASGLLTCLSEEIGKFTKWIGFPGELVPLTVVKMFSSSAATGLLLDIYKEFGTDSRNGLIASISMASTETIFYTMSVYYMTAKVTKTRYTLTGALLATFAGLAASVLLAGAMLGLLTETRYAFSYLALISGRQMHLHKCVHFPRSYNKIRPGNSRPDHIVKLILS